MVLCSQRATERSAGAGQDDAGPRPLLDPAADDRHMGNCPCIPSAFLPVPARLSSRSIALTDNPSRPVASRELKVNMTSGRSTLCPVLDDRG
jgi:hypothetical protein